MPPGSPTCTLRTTSFTFFYTQRGQSHSHIRLIAPEDNEPSSTVFSKIKRAQAAFNPPGRNEVAVHTAFEQHSTTQTNGHNSTNEQAHEKTNALGVDDDIERGM